MLLWVSYFASISIIVIILLSLYQRRRHEAMKKITDPIIILLISMLLIPLVFSASRTAIVLTGENQYNQAGSFAFVFALYYVLWIIGINKYLNQIIRIPKSRIFKFQRIQKLLYTGSIATFILTIIAFSIEGNLLELLFGIVALFALFSFLYFRSVILNEKDKNASKLIQARLDLYNYSVISQIVLLIILILGAMILSLDLITDGPKAEFFVFSALDLITIISAIVLFNTINIPNFIRYRYNLNPKRFKFIAKAEGKQLTK